MPVLATYSGADISLAWSNPLSGTASVGGVSAKGIAKVTVRMTTVQSTMQVGMDGAVVPSVAPGDQGEFEIEVWQTSTIQSLFLDWWNAIKAAELAGDVGSWFAGTMLIQSTTDGSTHSGTGVAPQKFPDKSYAEQAGRVTWIFAAANIVNQ